MRALASVCLVVAVAGVVVFTHTPLPKVQAPQFRTTVDLMRVDVTVLDQRTRRPIRGLTADDFTVIVGGQEQPIRSHAEVTAAGASAATGAWRQTAGHDVIVNERPPAHARLVVIVMSDARGDSWHLRRGKAVAHAIIDGLAPDDLAAVVFVNQTDNSQDFTKDRALLRAAVDSFNPLANPRFAAPSLSRTVKNVREFLGSVGSYRRAIFVVAWRGLGVQGTGAADPNWYWLRDAGLNDVGDEPGAAGEGPRPASRLSHVPLFIFTTFGLQATQDPGDRQSSEDTITLARVAGGRAIVQHNAPELEVPAVLEEMSTYYALAYQPTFPLDGKLRFVDVKVNRPNVLVLPSSGAVRTARDSDDPAVQRAVDTSARGSGLFSALARPMMVGDLPLRASAAALLTPGAREQPVVVTLGLPTTVTPGATEQFLVAGAVYDGEGRRQVSTFEQRVSVNGGERIDDLAETVMRFNLRPGRYNLRLAVEQVSSQAGTLGLSGSAHLSVAVPDAGRAPLVVSDVVIGRAEGRPVGGREALADVLPFAPTTVRTFARTDRVGALLRIQQAARAPVDAIVTTEIVSVHDEVVATATRTLPAAQFQAAAGVDHPYDLPLPQLSPGDYLLRFTVAAGKAQIHRDVRFTVQ